MSRPHVARPPSPRCLKCGFSWCPTPQYVDDALVKDSLRWVCSGCGYRTLSYPLDRYAGARAKVRLV